jgi:hypothetical protein
VPEVDTAPKLERKPLRPSLEKLIRTKPRPKRFRGVPPPLAFDLDALPGGTWLTEAETAAAIRRSMSALENWRLQQPDHPLKWRKVGGRILYELSSIRAYLKGEKVTAAWAARRRRKL